MAMRGMMTWVVVVVVVLRMARVMMRMMPSVPSVGMMTWVMMVMRIATWVMTTTSVRHTSDSRVPSFLWSSTRTFFHIAFQIPQVTFPSTSYTTTMRTSMHHHQPVIIPTTIRTPTTPTW